MRSRTGLEQELESKFFCGFDQAMTGAIYFTFRKGKKSFFDRPNYTSIQVLTYAFLSSENEEKKFVLTNKNFFVIQFIACSLRENRHDDIRRGF